MSYRLLLFGEAKEIVGSDFLLLSLPSQRESLVSLLQAAVNSHPGLSKIKPVSQIALNHEFIDNALLSTTLVTPLDEVAWIPPISAG